MWWEEGVGGAYRLCARKLEGKRLLGRPKCRYKYYTKTDLVDKAWAGFICLQDKWLAVVNTVMNLRAPYNAGNCMSS